VRSCEKLSIGPTGSMPPGSEMDLLVAKAKPLSDGGSTSVVTYLRRGKKILHDGNCSRRKE